MDSEKFRGFYRIAGILRHSNKFQENCISKDFTIFQGISIVFKEIQRIQNQ